MESDAGSIVEKANSGEFDGLSGLRQSGDLGVFYLAHVENGIITMI